MEVDVEDVGADTQRRRGFRSHRRADERIDDPEVVGDRQDVETGAFRLAGQFPQLVRALGEGGLQAEAERTRWGGHAATICNQMVALW